MKPASFACNEINGAMAKYTLLKDDYRLSSRCKAAGADIKEDLNHLYLELKRLSQTLALVALVDGVRREPEVVMRDYVEAWLWGSANYL